MSESITAVPYGVDTAHQSQASGSNTTNSYTDVNSTTYGTTALKTGANAESYKHFKVNLSEIPENAVIVSVTGRIKCTLRIGHTTCDLSQISACEAQLFTGTTAKGTATDTKSTTTTIYNIAGGNWTRNELLDARVRIYAKRANISKNTQTWYYDVYGAEITVVYNIPSANQLYCKDDGTWKIITKAYKKINGAWIEETDLTQVFDSNNQYIQGNIS